MFYTNTKLPKITILGTHGRNMAIYLKEYLETKGIRSNAVGLDFKNANVKRKINQCTVLICAHKEIEDACHEKFDLTGKEIICLDVYEMPESSSSRPLTGEHWIQYQEEQVKPALRSQIKKHLKKLALV